MVKSLINRGVPGEVTTTGYEEGQNLILDKIYEKGRRAQISGAFAGVFGALAIGGTAELINNEVQPTGRSNKESAILLGVSVLSAVLAGKQSRKYLDINKEYKDRLAHYQRAKTQQE